jgi:hypothetical protein
LMPRDFCAFLTMKYQINDRANTPNTTTYASVLVSPSGD